MATVRVKQGSQPTIEGVLVGVVFVGVKQGVPTARLQIRGGGESRVVDLAEGSSTLMAGGVLTVSALQPASEDRRGELDLTWQADQ